MKICNVPTKTHILKLREEFCDDVFAGYKNFEVRENDRNGGRMYWLTREGLDWLGEKLNIKIYDEEE